MQLYTYMMHSDVVVSVKQLNHGKFVHVDMHLSQGCIGGYTRVYAVYQPPVYFAGVYSPQLLYINRVYAVIRRAG